MICVSKQKSVFHFVFEILSHMAKKVHGNILFCHQTVQRASWKKICRLLLAASSLLKIEFPKHRHTIMQIRKKAL